MGSQGFPDTCVPLSLARLPIFDAWGNIRLSAPCGTRQILAGRPRMTSVSPNAGSAEAHISRHHDQSLVATVQHQLTNVVGGNDAAL